MDEEYDVVVCGTGLKECILSGLLSVSGKKVLHVDRNPYYGGESASLNLTNLYNHFNEGKPPSEYGDNRDWNVDLIPKFVMACGKLVKILLRTNVTRYLEWKVVEGTYVYQYQKGGMFSNQKFIHKVPSNDIEALKSPLLPLWEKNRCRSFLSFCAHWEENDTSTHKKFNPAKTTMKEVYDEFGLQANTIDFVGHALALYTNDDYLNKPMGPTMERIHLYMNSISRYGSSPFIYPIYGLGGLPEGFSRLSSIHGGVYMLNTPIDCLVYSNDGKVKGVKAKDGQVVNCKLVVCDPTYAPACKSKKVGQVIRCICLIKEPLPETDNKSSVQLIVPQKQLNRNNDIYVTMVSSAHGVAKKGFYIVIVSTTVETSDPEKEIGPALARLGKIEKKFCKISDIYAPTDDGTADQVFVTESYDATSHFESASNDVLRIWKNITGEDLDLQVNPDDLQKDT